MIGLCMLIDGGLNVKVSGMRRLSGWERREWKQQQWQRKPPSETEKKKK
jgi:hypothetical protein